MKFTHTLTAVCLGGLIAGNALAGVSAEEAAKIGKELTPMGAEAGANADGSIPAWDPAGPPIPASFVKDSDNYTNPYADEKPLFTIDNSNCVPLTL